MCFCGGRLFQVPLRIEQRGRSCRTAFCGPDAKKVDERVFARRTEARIGIEVERGMKQGMRVPAFRAPERQIVSERVHTCCRHIRVPFEIEGRIEERMWVRTFRGTYGQVVRERLAASGSDVRVLREIEGDVEQPMGRLSFPDSFLQIMQERVGLCFCGRRLFQVPLNIEQRMRLPAFSRTRNHEVHER